MAVPEYGQFASAERPYRMRGRRRHPGEGSVLIVIAVMVVPTIVRDDDASAERAAENQRGDGQ